MPPHNAPRNPIRILSPVLLLLAIAVGAPFASGAPIKRNGLVVRATDPDIFVLYAADGDYEVVTAGLDGGIDPNAKNDKGTPALVAAAEGGHPDVVSLLLRRGADPNGVDAKGTTPLMKAAYNGFDADKRAPNIGYPEIIRELVDKGADVNARNAEGIAALLWAAHWGDTKTVELFLARGADPNTQTEDGFSPLSTSALSGYNNVVRMLLDRGARVDIADATGRTPLMGAVKEAYDPDDKTYFAGFRATIDTLLAAGANVNAADAQGVTPLIEAARTGDIETSEKLLRNGANLNARTAEGASALDTAHAAKRPLLVRYLIEHGAQTNVWMRIKYLLFRFNILQGWATPVVLLLFTLLYRASLWRPTRPAKQTVEEGDGLPRLAPLTCVQCAAPVPIVPANLQCPSCGTPVKVPEDYTETLTLRERAARDLKRAVQIWRRLRILSASPIVLALLALGLLWLPVTFIGLFSGIGHIPIAIAILAGLGGVSYAFGFVMYALYLVGVGDMLPTAMPEVGRPLGETETAGCTRCGAPVQFRKGELVAQCMYCGGEIYRVALARKSRVAAAEEQASVDLSIYDAVCEAEDRKETLAFSFVFVTYMTSLVLAMIVVGVLMVVVYLLQYSDILIDIFT